MKLYYMPGTVALAVALTLEEAGLEYDAIKVDFMAAEQTKAPYLEINSKGRVPALDVDGQIITETGALLDYIGSLAPQLLPQDALEQARMRELMYYIASTFHVNHAHKLRGARWADREESWADMQSKVTQTMTASARHIEDHYALSPFVLGQSFSLADPYLYAVSFWLEADDVDMTAFPKLLAFREAVEARGKTAILREKGIIA